MKIKEEIGDIVVSSCRGARGGVSDGGMTSTSTTSFPSEVSNFTSNGESTVLSAAAADPSVAGLVGVGCIGGVKRKGKKMKGKKSKGKIKGVQGSSAPSGVEQVGKRRVIFCMLGYMVQFVSSIAWLQPHVGALASLG